MADPSRLIEIAFPLKQASLDSVHEKNVRHGHISTLHIWPARRPLAACRAALVCTLLPDPGNDKEREEILERLAGRIVRKVQRKKLPSGKVDETMVEETEGGILHWGRESGSDLQWFRQKIREAYGGRAPKVLDPFAGGGTIPLEAMRLGCEATAIDINPVAWFILKCTLEYPQRLAGQKRPLPKFALESPELIEQFLTNGAKNGAGKRKARGNAVQSQMLDVPEADLSWHVRIWGWWVLQRARADLERYYPEVDGKSTVAYLWARTVTCKNCRATLPLLKTRWLCKSGRKRVVLTMKPNADRTNVDFGIQHDVPTVGGNAAQRREHDKKVGTGTMSRSGAECPSCGTIMTMKDMRLEGQAGRLETSMTAVVVDGARGKEYRLPIEAEIRAVGQAAAELEKVFADIPLGLPKEVTPKGGSGASRAFSVDGYGLDQWYKLFTPRQLIALGVFIKHIRALPIALRAEGYPEEWVDAIVAGMACLVSKLADKNSSLVEWQPHRLCIGHTFKRFALPITWDFAEMNVLSNSTGNAWDTIIWICDILQNLRVERTWEKPKVVAGDAQHELDGGTWDLVVTDPPYYDAIPYADTMDFFYVWLRRTLSGVTSEIDTAFREPLSPKWNNETNDGELIDDASRFGGDKIKSKSVYEDGMYRAFLTSYKALRSNGELVIVFAHKQPAAWESLVAAIIRAGFVVDASWPIQTEMSKRMRAQSSAALSSSVWLVCNKRPEGARPGWSNLVLDEMHDKIHTRLREFWDAGIRGPDFVWAATGPALEAYSKHPVVKKADQPGQILNVSEFLRHVRRLVVDFVVGRALSRNGNGESTSGLDDVTTYYLLHRYDFGLGTAPIGACILYAISCGLSDTALADQHDVLVHTGGQTETENDEGEEDEEADAPDTGESSGGSRSEVRLRAWNQRKRKALGYETPGGRPAPLIDQVHHLMFLWKAGDVVKVDEYLAAQGLRRNALFHQLLQALIELAPHGSEERSLLESISNHIVSRGALPQEEQLGLPTP